VGTTTPYMPAPNSHGIEAAAARGKDEMPTWEVMVGAESAQHQLQPIRAASEYTACLRWDTPDNLAKH